MGQGMWNVKYQFMLNDVFGLWGGYGNASGYDLTSYSMTMSYLETMNFLLNTHKQIRFNQRQDRMYLDVDWSELREGEFLIIDCFRAMDGDEYSRVWNDSFLKKLVSDKDAIYVVSKKAVHPKFFLLMLLTDLKI